MSHFAPPLAGNRFVWFALTSNFSANRPNFRCCKKKAELSLSELWQPWPGSQRRRQPAFRTISTHDRSYFQPRGQRLVRWRDPCIKADLGMAVPLRREWGSSSSATFQLRTGPAANFFNPTRRHRANLRNLCIGYVHRIDRRSWKRAPYWCDQMRNTIGGDRTDDRR